jgi:hypothetical protein
LRNAVDVISRDRERFETESPRDPLDTGDTSVDSSAARVRKTLEVSPEAGLTILSRTPVIEVSETAKSRYVRVIDAGAKFLGCR